MMLLFGSLIVPMNFFEEYFFRVIVILNILSGLLLFLRSHRIVWFISTVFLLLILLMVINGVTETNFLLIQYGHFILYAIFYAFVSFDLVKQIWNAERVTGNIIMGTMSGYVCLGLLSYFAFVAAEIVHPGSFNGIPVDMMINEKMRQLLNFSFITMLTVGYGDISPATFVTQKLAVLTAMLGQFYLVIITAVVIGKFLLHKSEE